MVMKSVKAEESLMGQERGGVELMERPGHREETTGNREGKRLRIGQSDFKLLDRKVYF